MSQIFYEADADMSRLEGRTVAIVGYGNQGRAQALNMRDSGVDNMLIGSVRDDSWEAAVSDGFSPMPIAEAAGEADMVFMLVPDEVAPGVYQKEIEPTLRSGKTLNFASGYNVTFGHIVPPKEVDVIMVAPRMIGDALRSLFVAGSGAPCFVYAHRDASGGALEDSLAIAKGLGCTRAGAIEVSMEHETWMDLLTELGVMPLILSVFLCAYELEVEAGIPPEAVLLELYASKEPAEIMERVAEIGLFEQMRLHSRTSQYAHTTRIRELDRRPLKAFLREALSERIRSGRFDREWVETQESDEPVLEGLLQELSRHPIVETEKRLRDALQATGRDGREE